MTVIGALLSGVLAVLLGCGADANNPADAAPDATALDAGPRDAHGDVSMSRLGNPCGADSDCGGVQCGLPPEYRPADTAAPDLECVVPFEGGRPNEACSLPSDCDRGLCWAAGTCTRACRNNSDCGDDEVCSSGWIRTAPDALQPLRACAPIVTCTPSLTSVARDFFSHPDLSSTALVSLPHAASISLHILISDAGVSLVPRALRTADGASVALYGPDADAPPANPVYGTAGIMTVLIPNSFRTPHSPTGYELELTGARRGGGTTWSLSSNSTGVALELDVFYLGGRGWHPLDGAAPPEFALALAEVERIFSTAGITIGTVRHHDIVSRLRDELSVLTGGDMGYPELDRILALTRGLPRAGVPVFLVRSLDLLVGLVGGTPGSWCVYGTRASGVVVGADLLPTAPELGNVIAHEIGHFLGLWHTTEPIGPGVEPLLDTPECTRDRDSDGNGILSPDECVGAGAENLMFWARGGDELSPEQGEVMRRAFVLWP